MRSMEQWRPHATLPGVMERYIADDAEGKIHRQKVQDVAPAIAEAARVRNDTGGWSADRHRRQIGEIPATIVYDKITQWHREGRLIMGSPDYGMRLNELLKELLRDRDYAKFRTAENI